MKLFYISLILLSSITFSQNSWQTKFEKSNYLSTSNYVETVNYFQKLADSSEFAKLFTIGISPQGRELKCLIVSKNKIFSPDQLKNNKDAIILINNGIHSGEIEGKDASMLLLREMLITKKKENLLNNVTLLFIPVFNLDGHERISKYNRINQNGPTEMGWRTTAQNYNLNRDFMKADSPEMQALLKLYNSWLPDIFIDNHTIDGADYQYTITYGISKDLDIPPITRRFVHNYLIPAIENCVKDSTYLISPFVGFLKGNYENGIRDWVPTPRFSNGYAATQNRIGLLVETHMLKPYKDRVFATKALMESVIRTAGNNNRALRSISKSADEYSINSYSKSMRAFPIKYGLDTSFVKFTYKGFERIKKYSRAAGDSITAYSSVKTEKIVPYYNKAIIIDSVKLPPKYLIPREWSKLVNLLKLHGVMIDTLKEKTKYLVEKYKFKNVSFESFSYEGRFIPNFEYDKFTDVYESNIGDFIVNTNQRTIGVIAHLLEPKANDSFVKWGALNIIFERKEYFEEYSMAPIADKMLDESKELYKEFEKKIKSDSNFAANKWQRLNFFYERSPYYDKKHNIYPIVRIIK